MNMKQNAALEMFEYLKEHLIPLAKDKGDKVYESDTTVQIARPENKSVWDCEKEVKQLLSKIGAYSASVKNSINCVIINYSQTAQAVYIGFFVADRVTYEYIEERSFNTFIKNEKRIRGFSYSKDGILYGHSTPRAKPKEFNPSFSMYFATKETKHWPCTMKDLFSIHTYDGLFESVVYFIMLFFGETNPLWKDLAKDYTEQSAYSAIPLTVIDESHSKRELIAKYYGEDKAFKRNNKEPIGYGIFLARASNVVKPEQLQKLFGYDPGYISIGRAKNDLVKPLARYIVEEETDKIPKFCITFTADSIIPKFQKQWLDKYYPGKITDLVGISSPERKMKTMQIIASAYDVPINDVLFVDGERDKVAQAIECGFCGMTTIEVMTKMYEKYGEKH